MNPRTHLLELDAAEFDAVMAGLDALAGLIEGRRILSTISVTTQMAIERSLTNDDEHAPLTTGQIGQLYSRLQGSFTAPDIRRTAISISRETIQQWLDAGLTIKLLPADGGYRVQVS